MVTVETTSEKKMYTHRHAQFYIIIIIIAASLFTYTHAKERAHIHPHAHASCHFNGYMPFDLASHYIYINTAQKHTHTPTHNTYDRNHLKGLPVSWHKTRARNFGETVSKHMVATVAAAAAATALTALGKTIWIKTKNKPYYNKRNNNNNKSANECR